MIPKSIVIDYRYVVAGGWAACPALATDRDVWVMCPANEDPGEVRAKLLQNLSEGEYRYDYTEEDEDRLDLQGYTGLYQVLKVAKIRMDAWGGQDIHLLVTTADSALELVDAFDVSTHAVAIYDDGKIVRGTQWTPITEPPVMLRDTPTTAKRMAKIARRYGHEAVAQIWEGVAAQGLQPVTVTMEDFNVG